MGLESDIKSLVESMDMELYDISTVNEFDETIYRINVISKKVVDNKRSAVSLDECAELSRLISPLLDITPPVSGEYRLEVGSPGIERKLSSLSHFTFSVGDKVSLVLNDKTKIKGTLVNVDGSKISVDVDGETSVCDYSDVKKAKTYFEW